MRYGHLIVAALFLLFAYFQLNDPDPLKWVALYLATSSIALLAFFRQAYKWLAIGTLVAVGIWGIWLFPAFLDWVELGMPNIASEMKTEAPHIELTREFLGLLFCALVVGGYLVRGRRNWS